MSGPFTTITVEEYHRMQARIKALEESISAAEKSLPLGDPVGRILREVLRKAS